MAAQLMARLQPPVQQSEEIYSVTIPEAPVDPEQFAGDAGPEPVEAGETVASVEPDSVEVLTPLAGALEQAGPLAAAHAWAALYRMWGLQSAAKSDEQACAQAPAAGLRCLQGAGSWAVLQHYDRPAVLLLLGSLGRRVPVLLQEINGSMVTLQVDRQSLQVPVEELTRHWFGEYRLLWRTPPNGSAVLRPGDRSEDVQWLREQLQRATGLTSIAPDPRFFDAGLRELLQSFQSERELNADGVAGPRTFIVLDNLSQQPDVPRLGAARSDGPRS